MGGFRKKNLIRKLVNKDKSSIDPWESALASHNRGHLAEAEAQYWKILIEHSENVELLCNLGSALSGQKKFNQAVTCYRRAIAIDPDSWRTYANLGNAFKRMGKLDRAQASYQHALAIDDSVALLHYCLGNVWLQKGNLEKAAASLQKAIERQPDYIEAFIALSAIEETVEPGQGRKTLLDGISHNPGYTKTCPNKALARPLLFFGLEDCRFRLTNNNEIKMSGGHFQATELLQQQYFSKGYYYISEQNLLSNNTSLPPHDLIVNTIACPDRERQSLETLSVYLKSTPHAPVINNPDQVLQTTREQNYQRFHKIEGITFPRTIRAERQHIAQAIKDSGFSFPIIMRRVGTQSAVSTERLSGPDDIDGFLEATTGDDFYAIQYIDSRFREKYYRKLRLFCIDGKLYPVVCHIDTEWNVHGGNRKTLMKQNDWMQDEEKQFLGDFTAYIGTANRRLLESLHSIVKLDFYGIDFTIMDDGSILIFELNAAMRHSFVHAKALPYLTPFLNDISNAFRDMAVRKKVAR